jgi:hypothetical protein
MTLEMIFATRKWEGWMECIASWGPANPWLRSIEENDISELSILESYQLATRGSRADVLGFCHDDVVIHEPGWYERVMREFEDPSVGMVCFGGATQHGTRDLYDSPYHLPNLRRGNFMSNMKHAEQHGKRFTGECDVVVCDGFAMFIRREILVRCGGWPVDSPLGYFMYAEWVCCETRRQGYRIRLVGVSCDHLGGKTSTMVQVKDDFQKAHRYFWETNRDVMPAEVTP